MGYVKLQKWIVNYDYFNLPDSAISLDHFDYGVVPQCNYWDANYFVMNGLVFSSVRQVERYALKILDKGGLQIYFKMQNDGHKMSDIAMSMKQFVLIEAGNRGVKAKVLTNYNEEQRTGYICLERL